MPTDTREATPRPWRVEKDTTLIWGACDPDDNSTYGMGYPIATAHTQLGAGSPFRRIYKEDEARANAALIVLAVNHFDEVVEVLRDLLDRFTRAFPASREFPPIKRGYDLLSKLEASQ